MFVVGISDFLPNMSCVSWDTSIFLLIYTSYFFFCLMAVVGMKVMDRHTSSASDPRWKFRCSPLRMADVISFLSCFLY